MMAIERELVDDYTLYTDVMQPDVLVCDHLTYAPYGRNSTCIVEIFDPILTSRNTGRNLESNRCGSMRLPL